MSDSTICYFYIKGYISSVYYIKVKEKRFYAYISVRERKCIVGGGMAPCFLTSIFDGSNWSAAK
jgi:hypothetical protein